MPDNAQKTMTHSPGIHGGHNLFLDGEPIAMVVPHYDARGSKVKQLVERVCSLWNQRRGAVTFVTNDPNDRNVSGPAGGSGGSVVSDPID